MAAVSRRRSLVRRLSRLLTLYGCRRSLRRAPLKGRQVLTQLA